MTVIILIVMEVIIILVLISLGKSIYFAVDLLEESNKYGGSFLMGYQ